MIIKDGGTNMERLCCKTCVDGCKESPEVTSGGSLDCIPDCREGCDYLKDGKCMAEWPFTLTDEEREVVPTYQFNSPDGGGPNCLTLDEAIDVMMEYASEEIFEWGKTAKAGDSIELADEYMISVVAMPQGLYDHLREWTGW